MLTLGVETSALTALALRRDGQTLMERQLDQSRQRHAQTLVFETQLMLREAGLSPQDIELVAVSHGPGSFTGLRVGVVFAKTLAFATGCQLAAVDTLQAVAQAAADDLADVLAVCDAQREQLFVGHYHRNSSGWLERLADIAIVDNAAFLESLKVHTSPHQAVTGSGLHKLRSLLPDTCRICPEADWQPKASLIAALGERQAEAGLLADAFALEPFYLRLSSAEEKRLAQQQQQT